METIHFASYGGIFFRKSQAFMKAAFKKIGLSFVDSIVLINVCEHPEIIQDQIAANLALDAAAVARSLKQMEADGLVTREIDENNQRTKKVHATAKGKKSKVYIDTVMKRWNEHALEGFTEAEKKSVIAGLLRLSRNVSSVDMDTLLRE